MDTLIEMELSQTAWLLSDEGGGGAEASSKGKSVLRKTQAAPPWGQGQKESPLQWQVLGRLMSQADRSVLERNPNEGSGWELTV